MLILAGLGLAAERVISHHTVPSFLCAIALRGQVLDGNSEHYSFLRENGLVYDRARLESVRNRAQRLILDPILQSYKAGAERRNSRGEKVNVNLARQISISIKGIDGLARELCEIWQFSQLVTDHELLELFPRCILDEGGSYTNPCFSDFDLLYCFMGDLALHLTSLGGVLCFAQDGNHKTHVGCDKFDEYLDPEELYGLPLKNDWWMPYEISKELCFRLGAEELYFAFERDCCVPLEMEPKTARLSVVKSPTSWSKVDEPFVLEGIKMVQDGEATSANDAALLLIANYGCLPSGRWRKKSGTIRATSEEAARDRLQREISKALKDK